MKHEKYAQGFMSSTQARAHISCLGDSNLWSPLGENLPSKWCDTKYRGTYLAFCPTARRNSERALGALEFDSNSPLFRCCVRLEFCKAEFKRAFRVTDRRGSVGRQSMTITDPAELQKQLQAQQDDNRSEG